MSLEVKQMISTHIIKPKINSWLNKHPKAKEWLWFVGLWFGGLFSLYLVSSIIKLMMKL